MLTIILVEFYAMLDRVDVLIQPISVHGDYSARLQVRAAWSCV